VSDRPAFTPMDLASAVRAGVVDGFLVLVRGYEPQGGEVPLPEAFYAWLRERADQPERPEQLELWERAALAGPREPTLDLLPDSMLGAAREELVALAERLGEADSAAVLASTLDNAMSLLRFVQASLGWVLADDAPRTLQ
jgi:hypothetical protein